MVRPISGGGSNSSAPVQSPESLVKQTSNATSVDTARGNKDQIIRDAANGFAEYKKAGGTANLHDFLADVSKENRAAIGDDSIKNLEAQISAALPSGLPS